MSEPVLPDRLRDHAAMSAACGKLGERDAATKALRDLLKLRPGFAATVRKDLEKWWEPEYMERLIDGWRKAGLESADGEQGAAPAKPAVKTRL